MSRWSTKGIDTSVEEDWTKNVLLENNGLISRYILEGMLLYDLKCSNNKMYHTLMNLILKEELELVELDDGEYYSLNTF